MRDVQGSAGVGVREQTLEHELAERKRRVHMHQQNRTRPLLLAFQRGRAREASAVRRNAARLEQERWDVRVRYNKIRTTINFRLRRSTTGAAKTRTRRVLRVPTCHGMDGRGRCVTKLTQGHDGVDGDETAATKWSSEPWRGPDREEDGSRGRRGTGRPGHCSRRQG